MIHYLETEDPQMRTPTFFVCLITMLLQLTELLRNPVELTALF